VLPTDLRTLAARLSDLAEVCDRKPPSERAMAVWFDTLKEFPIERVASLLIAWPKTHTKFPAPAELWKVVNDMGIGERETRAARENAGSFHPGVGGERAEEFIAKMRAILKRPKWTPLEHWRANLKRFPKEHIGHRYALEALHAKEIIEQPEMQREPGQDDEELVSTKVAVTPVTDQRLAESA